MASNIEQARAELVRSTIDRHVGGAGGINLDPQIIEAIIRMVVELQIEQHQRGCLFDEETRSAIKEMTVAFRGTKSAALTTAIGMVVTGLLFALWTGIKANLK